MCHHDKPRNLCELCDVYDQIAKLEQKLNRAREVIRFYGHQTIVDTPRGKFNSVSLDKGEKARAFLLEVK